ncbi:Uncharacterised protein [Achromobacter sp. 2789STDY5608621]|nr:Uncharacterised protein [Achromobacter sp. 2789STDY5608621]
MAARIGQVPQPPADRILARRQRLFVPQAFAGEHLGRIQFIDVRVQQGMRGRRRQHRAVALHGGMAAGLRAAGPRQQARQAGTHRPGLGRTQRRALGQVRGAQRQGGCRRRPAGHADRPAHGLGQHRRVGGRIQQIEQVRGLAGLGRAPRPGGHAHRLDGPVHQRRQLAPRQRVHCRRVRRQPQRQAALEAPGRDARAGRHIGGPPLIFRIIVRIPVRPAGAILARRRTVAPPHRRHAGQRLPRMLRRHGDHAHEVFAPHRRHHARLGPCVVQAHAVERAAAIAGAVPASRGRAQRQPVQQVGRRLDGECRGLG